MIRYASLALAALVAAAPSAVRADDLSTVRTKVQDAMRNANSFVVTTTGSSGLNLSTTYVAPDRFHSAFSYNGTNRDAVLVGSAGYISSDGGPYRKVDAPADVVSTETQLRDVPVDAVLPDTTVGGTTYGQFATTTAGPQKDQRLTCTYDKRTYRLTVCRNESMTLTFSRYDDPANVVTVPTNLAPATH